MKAKHTKMLLIVGALAAMFYVYRRRAVRRMPPMLPTSSVPALPNVNNTRSWASTAN